MTLAQIRNEVLGERIYRNRRILVIVASIFTELISLVAAVSSSMLLLISIDPLYDGPIDSYTMICIIGIAICMFCLSKNMVKLIYHEMKKSIKR